jgi:hypothetical protein
MDFLRAPHVAECRFTLNPQSSHGRCTLAHEKKSEYSQESLASVSVMILAHAPDAPRAWVSRTRYLLLSLPVSNRVPCGVLTEGPDKNSRSVWRHGQSPCASAQPFPFSAYWLMQTMAPPGQRNRQPSGK